MKDKTSYFALFAKNYVDYQTWRISWTEINTRGDMGNAYKTLVGKLQERDHFEHQGVEGN
jgi:hypothetical protein